MIYLFPYRLLFDDVLYDVIFFLPIVNLLKLNWSNRRLYEIMERHKAIEMSPRIIRDIVINEEGFKVLRPKGSDEKWKMVVPPLPGSQLPAEILGFHCIKLDMEAIKESHSNPNQIVSQVVVFSAILILIATHHIYNEIEMEMHLKMRDSLCHVLCRRCYALCSCDGSTV